MRLLAKYGYFWKLTGKLKNFKNFQNVTLMGTKFEEKQIASDNFTLAKS